MTASPPGRDSESRGGAVPTDSGELRKTSHKKRPSRADRALAGTTLLGVATIALSATVALQETWPPARELWLMRTTGWSACGGLLLSLSMTPLERSTRRLRRGRAPAVWWIAYRRAFGIVAAVMALMHTALVLTTYLAAAWSSILYWPYLRSGLCALVILVALLLTSFPRLVAASGLRGWKELHRLAYVAAPLVFHHLLLAPFASRKLTLLIFGTWMAIMLLRFVPARKKKKNRGEKPLPRPS